MERRDDITPAGRLVRCLLALLLALLFCAPSGIAAPAAWADEPAAEEGAGEQEEPQANHVTELFLKWSADYNGENEFVGPEQPLKKVVIENKGQLVQLNGYYTDASGSGLLLETASSSTDLGAIDLVWESSDVRIAKVSPAGLVTPVKNGSCTITAKVKDPEKYGEASCSVDFQISGQNGSYVSDVEITTKKGKVINETVVLAGDGAKPVYYQLYATITWKNASGEVVRTESTSAKSCKATYTWSVAGNTDTVAVNKYTGRVASQSSGIGQVMVTVNGGKGGRTVSDTVYFRVDTGQYDYNPADSLTLKVAYEEYPDQVVEEKTYSNAQLAKMLATVTHNYTVIGGSNGSYATIRATGYMFKDILKLLNCSMNDIKQFRFGTADSYDSPVSYSYLFGSERYYFPDYDIGYTSGGVVVPPIIATANSMHWNEPYVSKDEVLDEGTRYRLVFGASGKTDANTSKQVYYINTINVILKGAPPSSNGTGDGDGNGAGNGSGMGAGPSSGDGDAGSGANGTDSTAAGGAGTGSDADSGTRWRIYQMMSTNQSSPGVLEMENPLAPFAVPIGIGVFLLGGLSFYIGFKRRRFA
ncbi:MAG: Ig domain-containing protein [Coriobacteriales bacterium]